MLVKGTVSMTVVGVGVVGSSVGYLKVARCD